MSYTRRELNMMNVTPGATATLVLPLGMTYERLMLRLAGGLTKAHLTAIRIRANSKVVHECSALQLEQMNNYTKMYSDPKFLAIDFSELRARDQPGQSIGAIGTLGGMKQLVLEIEISAAAPAGIKLDVFSQVTGPKQLDFMNKLIRYPANLAAGKSPVVLPFGPNGSVIKRIFVFSQYMTDLEIKKNGVTIHSSDKDVIEFWQKENDCVPQPGMYVFDPMVDKNATDMLRTDDAQTFEFIVNLSQSEAITVFVEYIDRLENL